MTGKQPALELWCGSRVSKAGRQHTRGRAFEVPDEREGVHVALAVRDLEEEEGGAFQAPERVGWR